MEVYVCGHNSFNQLDLDYKSYNADDNTISTKRDYEKQNPALQPSHQLSLPANGGDADIDIQFTWASCVVSFKTGYNPIYLFLTDDGKYLTHVTNASEKKTSVLCFENTRCASVVDGNGVIVLQDTTDTYKMSALHHGMSHSAPLTIRSGADETPCSSLHKLAGGHRDVYAVYDGVSFGKFQVNLPHETCPVEEGIGNLDAKQCNVTITIQHIDFVTPIKQISCGKEHVLLLSSSGGVYSYGLSSRGQLGHGEIEKEASPRLMDALDGLTMRAVAAGGWHSTAVSDIGDLYVWGWNESGQLGLRSAKKQQETAGTVSVSEGHKDQDKVDADAGIVATPVCVDPPSGENVKGVACGSRHTVVLTDSGQIFTCGWNGYGQLGLGDTRNIDGLTRVDGLTGHSVFAGQWNSAFVCLSGRAMLGAVD